MDDECECVEDCYLFLPMWLANGMNNQSTAPGNRKGHDFLPYRLVVSQEKKLKNWYIQEYTTGTTFEPNIKNIKKKVT